MRIGCWISALVLLAPLALCIGPQGPATIPIPADFYYSTQSFECYLEENGIKARITQVITIRCTDGCMEAVNLTLPYGLWEIRRNEFQEESSFMVLTVLNEPVENKLDQNETHTTVSISLPKQVYTDEDISLVLKYWIHDLSGDKGITKPLRTLMDRLLLRSPTRFLVTYRPAVFVDRVDEVTVRIFPPLDLVLKSWEPETGGDYDPATGRVSVLWHLTDDIPETPAVRVVLTKGAKPDPVAILLFVFIGLALIVFVISDRAIAGRRSHQSL